MEYGESIVGELRRLVARIWVGFALAAPAA